MLLPGYHNVWRDSLTARLYGVNYDSDQIELFSTNYFRLSNCSSFPHIHFFLLVEIHLLLLLLLLVMSDLLFMGHPYWFSLLRLKTEC